MIKKLLAKVFGSKIRLIAMTEHQERYILKEMSKIEGIDDYFELQKQAGYQLYGRTKDEKYLGYVDLANTLGIIIKDARSPQEIIEEDTGGGYESVV